MLNRAILFWITQLFTVILMAAFVVGMIYPDSRIADPRLMWVYLAALAAYVLVKEIDRWTGRLDLVEPTSSWKGKVFVPIWAVFLIAAFFLHFYNQAWIVPDGMPMTVVGVILAFAVAGISKRLYLNRPLEAVPAPVQAKPIMDEQVVREAKPHKRRADAQQDDGKILKLLKENPQGMSCTEVTDATGMAYRTAFRHLDELVRKKHVRKIGAARATRYFAK